MVKYTSSVDFQWQVAADTRVLLMVFRCLSDLLTEQETLYNIAPLKADRAAVQVVQAVTPATFS